MTAMTPTHSGICLVSTWLVNLSECRARCPREEVINIYCLAESLTDRILKLETYSRFPAQPMSCWSPRLYTLNGRQV